MTGMRKRIGILMGCAMLLLITAAAANAETVYAKSVSYNDVAAAVHAAGYGDTVVVPSGTATWTSGLAVSKYLTLKGAGIGKTIVRSAIGNNDAALISYSPDAVSRGTDGLFRVTGFTLDGNNFNSSGIIISNGGTELVENIRIDHNRIVECKRTGVKWSGFVHGLVDNNEFHNNFKTVDVYGNLWKSWELIPRELGSKHAVYIEDNRITFTNGSGASGITSGGLGGRYVSRYNTIDNPQSFDVWDMHGNQKPVTEAYRNDHRGTVFGEIYGNTVTSFGTNNRAGRIVAHRGGTAIVFGNTVTGTESRAVIDLWEEDGPERFNYLTSWPGYDRHRDSYYWSNRYNGAAAHPGVKGLSKDFIRHDRDYWRQIDGFNGSSGMGVGPYSAIPSNGNEGVGYWATDRSALYRWSSGRWVKFYEPYTYPHPLTAGEIGTPVPVTPNPPVNFRLLLE